MRRERLTITLQDNIIKKLDNFIDGDKVRNRSHAIEVILRKHLQSGDIKKAVILGGGERITFKGKKISKLLLPIGDKTLIEHNIEILKSFGINDIILSLGKYGEDIRDIIQDGSNFGVKVMYFERDYGNAWVLRQAKSLLRETFLMMNGDILLENIDLDDMSNFHRNNKGKGTLLIATEKNTKELGTIILKGNNIIGFKEKTQHDGNNSQMINGGVYLLESEICDMVNPNFSSLEYDIFPKLAGKNSLFGYSVGGNWFHLHDEEKYNKYLELIKKIK